MQLEYDYPALQGVIYRFAYRTSNLSSSFQVEMETSFFLHKLPEPLCLFTCVIVSVYLTMDRTLAAALSFMTAVISPDIIVGNEIL